MEIQFKRDFGDAEAQQFADAEKAEPAGGDYAPTTVVDLYMGQDRQAALAAVAAHLRREAQQQGEGSDDDGNDDAETVEVASTRSHRAGESTTDDAVLEDPTVEAETEIVTELAVNQKSLRRYEEIKAHIKSFERYIGKNYEVGINFKHYFEYAQSRLRVVAVYGSGSVSFLGVNDEGQMVNYFDHIDSVCFTLIQLPRLDSELPRRDIVFCYTSDGKLEHLE